MCAIDFEPVIATERLRLRKPRKADTARLAQHANDFDVARMTTAMPYPYGLDHAEGFLAQVSAQDPDREVVFVIEHPEHGAIGVMGQRRNRNRLLAGPALLGRGLRHRGRARRADLGPSDLGPALSARWPLRRQPGFGPGAVQGRLPLYGRGAATPLGRARRPPSPDPNDGLAGLTITASSQAAAKRQPGMTCANPSPARESTPLRSTCATLCYKRPR